MYDIQIPLQIIISGKKMNTVFILNLYLNYLNKPLLKINLA